mmetsp:Transcript_90511/g.255505  ORF Transcript_90511/g.255505 Transcript_90511/m.255505 type:complete len:364 (+) Transcript_90511:85-1176(+)
MVARRSSSIVGSVAVSACLMAGVALLVVLPAAYIFPLQQHAATSDAPAIGTMRRSGILVAATAALTAQAPPTAPAWADMATPVATTTAIRGDVVALNNGMSFPKASFGLQVYDDGTAQRLTETAIAVGYRNFFASVLANNQRGFAKGVKASGVPREELFICGTVLSNRARGFESAYQETKRGCDDNLKALAVGDITYVDMIMLDYPGPDCDSIMGQWKAFEEMLAAGTTKSLAVSNFSPDQLDCLLVDKAATVPTVNQLPFSISYYDPNAVEDNRKRGIVVQSWAPLGGSTGGISLRARKACEEVGKTYGKSWAQVALRWIVEKGGTFSTQTKSKEHFVEDLNVFDFSLSDADLAKLAKVSRR